MRRALAEYVVAGIKTTVPFFRWLLEQPDFLEGRFHTTYLDEVLKARNGRPFVEPSPEAEDVAAIAAALAGRVVAGLDVLDGGPRRYRPTPSRWKAQARAEALR